MTRSEIEALKHERERFALLERAEKSINLKKQKIARKIAGLQERCDHARADGTSAFDAPDFLGQAGCDLCGKWF